MTEYRNHLPQLDGDIFLTDSGLETTLIFREGIDLPYFAAFHLLKDATGRKVLRQYFLRHANIARDQRTGFILESPTWRSNTDWGARLRYSSTELAEVNRLAIDLLAEIRDEFVYDAAPIVISGCVGPRGDGYDPQQIMTVEQATTYHAAQIGVFAESTADMITAITMTNVPECIGVTRAATDASIPVAIAVTVETNGTLPTGQALREAIEEIDEATGEGPAYYMISCAHPTHFEHVLDDGPWMRRLRGIRANASTCSHAELDNAEVLDAGDPYELGQQYATLRQRYPHINVLGGCCGTDHRHIEKISLACCPETQGQKEQTV